MSNKLNFAEVFSRLLAASRCLQLDIEFLDPCWPDDAKAISIKLKNKHDTLYVVYIFGTDSFSLVSILDEVPYMVTQEATDWETLNCYFEITFGMPLP